MNFAKITLNFLAIILLIGLIATPIYFAKNLTKVSGIKSESKYLVISQVEKFPGMVFAQSDNQYIINFTKLGPSQAYLGVLVVNNPTDHTQTYSLDPSNTVFFGQDLDNRLTQISIPPKTSVPISLFSDESQDLEQQVEFTITASSE